MRTLLLLLSVLTISLSKAATYYVSTSGGSDERSELEAQHAQSPWQSINKINSRSLTAGDSILFKRGETFFGCLIIKRSGIAGKPIFFGAYGIGKKPVITGFTYVTNWQNRKNNIYENYNSNYPANVNIVLVDGAFQPIARYPRANSIGGGWLTNQSHVGHSELTSDAIANLPSFVGGEIVMKKYQWIIDRGRITDQSNSTITIEHDAAPHHPSVYYDIMDNHGFFFQNHINTLTARKDWCYDHINRKLLMLSPESSNVQVSTTEELVVIDGQDYLSFRDITFTGANSFAFDISSGSSNISIKNCDIAFSGIDAIHVSSPMSNNIVVDGCNISFTNNNAIEAGSSKNWHIQNNTITNTGMIEGMGGTGDGQYNAISYTSDGSVIENNRILKTGYLGIHFTGSNTIVRNNYLDSFVMIKSDGGGIYTYGETNKVNRIVTGNIILHGPGNLQGVNIGSDSLNPYAGQVHGIYMDGGTANVTITNNTVANCAHSGIWLSSPKGITVTGNTLYNNFVVQLKVAENVDNISNLTLKQNILFGTDSASLIGSFNLHQSTLASIGTIDSNYYARPLYDPVGVSTYGYPNFLTFFNYPGGGIIEASDFKFYSLDTWKALSNQDMHTVRSPVTVNDLKKLRFEYNASSLDTTIDLDGMYVDVKNNQYNNSVTLKPFSSIVLINTVHGCRWNGNISSDWDNAANWDDGTVPNSTTSVYIPARTPNPPVILSNLNAAQNISIAKGASLTINGNASLTVFGALKNNSNILGMGRVILNGVTKQTISGKGTINNLEINNVSGIAILYDSKVEITGVLTLTAGTFYTSDALILKSNSDNTARIAPVLNGNIEGNVTVERYVASQSTPGFRLLAPTVTTRTSIRDNWQEGVNNTDTITNNNPVAGCGTHITGSSNGRNGFDANSDQRPSLFTFDEGSAQQSWLPISNTDSNNLDANKGYLLFVKGDRSIDISQKSVTNNTILRATGLVQTGTVMFKDLESNGRNSLITNPYPSPINWETLSNKNSKNFENYYTFWDPTVGSKGGYVTVDASGTTSVKTSLATTQIPSGQAFFIKSKSAITLPSFVVQETDKSINTTTNVFRSVNTAIAKLYTSLYYFDSLNQRTLTDGALARYNKEYSSLVDGYDAEDTRNFEENISFGRKGKMLSIESRPSVTANDTLFIKIENLTKNKYEWQFDLSDFNLPEGIQPFLIDKFLRRESSIAESGISILDFAVTADSNSHSTDRFSIIFKATSTLPVKMLSVKAEVDNGVVNVIWRTTNEVNIKQFIVEKSDDAITFYPFDTITPKNLATTINNYSSIDHSPKNGYNYYRIITLNNNGERESTNVVRVSLGRKASINIAPNPVVGQSLNLELMNLKEGLYQFRILNLKGQSLFEQQLKHPGGSTTNTFHLNNNFIPGTYVLQIAGQGEMMTKQLLKL